MLDHEYSQALLRGILGRYFRTKTVTLKFQGFHSFLNFLIPRQSIFKLNVELKLS